MPRIDLPSVSVYYELSGDPDKPVLLLSNSLGTNLHMWEPIREAIEPHFHLLRYDMRGHGQSSIPAGPYTIDQCGHDILYLLDALHLTQVHYCGLSVGGMLGQWLGINAPHRLRKLMLCNTAAKIGTLETWTKRIDDVQADGLSAIAGRILQGWFTPDFLASADPIIETMRAMLRYSPPEGYVATCAAIRDMDLREKILSIKLPTLILAGLFDPSTTLVDAQFLQSRIALSKLVTLPTAHISCAQAPQQFASILLDFFTKDPTP